MGQLKQRIGNFLILIGILLLILFFASNANETPNFLFLLGGVGSVFLGYQFAKRPRIEPSESKRFRTVRRIMGQRLYEDDPDEELPYDRN